VAAPSAVVLFNDFPGILPLFSFAFFIFAPVANDAGVTLYIFNIGRLSAPIAF
jgi:hypothetical protein